MNKCLKISFSGEFSTQRLYDFIQSHAKKLNLEGTVRASDKEVNIFVCGMKDAVDDFLDVIYKGEPKLVFKDILIEPYIKDKDFRGVFRALE